MLDKQKLPDKPWLKVTEFAGENGAIPVHCATIHCWVDKGTFPKPYVISPRIRRWRKKDIERWMDNKIAEHPAYEENDQ